VVVDGDREGLLGDILADDVVVEKLIDLARLGQLFEGRVGGITEFFLNDLVAQIDALVTNVDTGARNELLDLLLALPAKRALEEVTPITNPRHGCSLERGQANALRGSDGTGPSGGADCGSGAFSHQRTAPRDGAITPRGPCGTRSPDR